MILYANGCSHTAAAEAVVSDCFALDDGRNGIDRRPHPTNLAASWCTRVAHRLGMDLECQAESGGSNPRIIRTTKAWLEKNQHLWHDVLVIIQWTTWEREEWLHEDTWYQVNASGVDWVPAELQDRYKRYVVDVDWNVATQRCHEQAWELHQWLANKSIKHMMFSGHSTFSDIQNRYNWGRFYMDPYLREGSYHNWLIQNGGKYANPNTYHFDAASHRLWAEHVLQYINRNQILDPVNEISVN